YTNLETALNSQGQSAVLTGLVVQSKKSDRFLAAAVADRHLGRLLLQLGELAGSENAGALLLVLGLQLGELGRAAGRIGGSGTLDFLLAGEASAVDAVELHVLAFV
nr:hypothetical protein [Tanacetum cinerariifolium]